MSGNNPEALKPILTNAQVREQMKRIPGIWSGVPPKVIKHGLRFGLIRLGWTVKDYLLHAVETMGYCTVAVWGEQGTGKSCRMLQHGFWIYGDWDTVLRNIVFEPLELVRKLQSLSTGKRVPWLGWDDVGVFYPSVTWRTDIHKYAAIDAAWTAIRTKCSVVTLTIPLIDRLAKNLRDNVSIEEFLGRNQNVLSERYIRLPGIRDRLESNFRKVQIEPIHRFNLYDVPTDVFRQYWEQMRLPLTEKALDGLAKTVGLEVGEVEGYIPVLDAIEEVDLSPTVLTQLCARGTVRKKRVGGLLYVNREDFERVKKYYQAKDQKKRREYVQ